MSRNRILMLLFILIGNGFSNLSHAQLVQINATASAQTTFALPFLQDISPFNVDIVYNTSAEASRVEGNEVFYDTAISEINVTFGNLLVTFDQATISLTDNEEITLSNGDIIFRDRFNINTEITPSNIQGTTDLQGLDIIGFDFTLYDSDGLFINNSALPTNAPPATTELVEVSRTPFPTPLFPDLEIINFEEREFHGFENLQNSQFPSFTINEDDELIELSSGAEFTLVFGSPEVFGGNGARDLVLAFDGFIDTEANSITIQPVPIPAAVWLLGTGLLTLIRFRKLSPIL